jgi:hypothetical protein
MGNLTRLHKLLQVFTEGLEQGGGFANPASFRIVITVEHHHCGHAHHSKDEPMANQGVDLGRGCVRGLLIVKLSIRKISTNERK